jgi:hypothetical protein
MIQDEKETRTLMMLAVIVQHHQGAAQASSVRTGHPSGFEFKG